MRRGSRVLRAGRMCGVDAGVCAQPQVRGQITNDIIIPQIVIILLDQNRSIAGQHNLAYSCVVYRPLLPDSDLLSQTQLTWHF